SSNVFQCLNGVILESNIGAGAPSFVDAAHRHSQFCRADGIAQTPACHGEALGKTAAYNGIFFQAHVFEDAVMGFVENNIAVDLVTEDAETMPASDIRSEEHTSELQSR